METYTGNVFTKILFSQKQQDKWGREWHGEG